MEFIVAKKKQNICGRCGEPFIAIAGSPYTTLCGSCPSPHMCVGKISGASSIRELMAVIRSRLAGEDAWNCDYCGEAGTLEDLRQSKCQYVYLPCDTCGGNPFCEPDCSQMSHLLSRHGTYVVGGNGKN